MSGCKFEQLLEYSDTICHGLSLLLQCLLPLYCGSSLKCMSFSIYQQISNNYLSIMPCKADMSTGCFTHLFITADEVNLYQAH